MSLIPTNERVIKGARGVFASIVSTAQQGYGEL